MQNHSCLCIYSEGEEIQSYQGLFDQSFSVHGDCFGDEEMAVDLIGEFIFMLYILMKCQ